MKSYKNEETPSAGVRETQNPIDDGDKSKVEIAADLLARVLYEQFLRSGGDPANTVQRE